VGPNIGIEASGGIRSAADALAMIAAGATRVRAAVGHRLRTAASRLGLFLERLIRRSNGFLEAGDVRE
jgi:deoxyribose-phosphate aldolase